MIRGGSRTWVGLLVLAVGGFLLWRILPHGGPPSQNLTSAAPRAAAHAPAKRDGILHIPRSGHARALGDSALSLSLDSAVGISPSGRMEDWRTSPRLWSFSQEEADRVDELLEAFATAAREGRWDVIERLTLEFKKLGERAVGPLLDVLLRAPDDRLRVYAAGLLGQLQESVPGGLLGEALRVYATPMIEALAAGKEDPGLRHSALVAMGQIGDPRALDFLLETLREERAWPLMKDAIQALGSLRDAGVTGTLADLAQSEPDPDLRERLVRALGERRDPAARSALEDLARRDLDPDVREAALSALGQLGVPEADRVLKDIVEDDVNASVRSAAAEALGRPGDEGSLDFLADVLASPGDPEVRTAAYLAMKNIGTPDARAAVADYKPAVRVDRVIPGSQAQALGLSPNDVITGYNGKPIRRAGDLPSLVRSTPTNQFVPFVVIQDGRKRTYYVHGGLLGVQIEDGVVFD